MFWPRESWGKNVFLLSPQLSRGQNIEIFDGNAGYSDPWCFKNRQGIVLLDAWIVAESEKWESERNVSTLFHFGLVAHDLFVKESKR